MERYKGTTLSAESNEDLEIRLENLFSYKPIIPNENGLSGLYLKHKTEPRPKAPKDMNKNELIKAFEELLKEDPKKPTPEMYNIFHELWNRFDRPEIYHL